MRIPMLAKIPSVAEYQEKRKKLSHIPKENGAD